jgi:parallel beta-helix repeat protein
LWLTVKKELLVILVMVGLLASGMLRLQPAEANFKPAPLPHIYIRSDGGITPPSAPISQNGNVYTLTGDINNSVLDIKRSNAMIDGAGFSLPSYGYEEAILLTGVTNVTVTNFNITGRNIAIHLNASSYNTIVGNSIVDASSYGIWLSDRSDGNEISGNSIERCYYGIYIGNSRNNVVRNNSIVSQETPPPLVIGISQNTPPPFVIGVNFAVVGSVLEDFVNDVDDSNIVDGKPVYYWVNRQNAEVPPNAGYVALVNCTGITVKNQNLTKNKQGVLLAWTTGSTVRGSSMEYNADGIYLLHSSGNLIANNSAYANHGIEDNEGNGIRMENSHDNILSGNNVTSNYAAGIQVSACSGDKILGNSIASNSRNGIRIINYSNKLTIYRNYLTDNSEIALRITDSTDNFIVGNNITENHGFALQLMGSQKGNTIYGNNFVNNQVYGKLQVSMPGVSAQQPVPNSNAWDNGTIGNYWYDYLTRYTNASEIGASGIGDTPFVINENNVDHYPLIAPIDASTVDLTNAGSSPPPASPSPTSSATATPNSSTSPFASSSSGPSPTEQPTASNEQPRAGDNNEFTLTMYVATALITIALASIAVVAVMLRKIYSDKVTGK